MPAADHLTLDQLEDLHQSTTPGPWELADGGWGVYVTARDGEYVWARTDVPNAHDCAFVVEAHRQWPGLLSEIRRLRGELAIAQRQVDDIDHMQAGRCPDCGGSLQRRRVSEEREILEGCVCDGPYGEPTWAGV